MIRKQRGGDGYLKCLGKEEKRGDEGEEMVAKVGVGRGKRLYKQGIYTQHSNLSIIIHVIISITIYMVHKC